MSGESTTQQGSQTMQPPEAQCCLNLMLLGVKVLLGVHMLLCILDDSALEWAWAAPPRTIHPGWVCYCTVIYSCCRTHGHMSTLLHHQLGCEQVPAS